MTASPSASCSICERHERLEAHGADNRPGRDDLRRCPGSPVLQMFREQHPFFEDLKRAPCMAAPRRQPARDRATATDPASARRSAASRSARGVTRVARPAAPPSRSSQREHPATGAARGCSAAPGDGTLCTSPERQEPGRRAVAGAAARGRRAGERRLQFLAGRRRRHPHPRRTRQHRTGRQSMYPDVVFSGRAAAQFERVAADLGKMARRPV